MGRRRQYAASLTLRLQRRGIEHSCVNSGPYHAALSASHYTSPAVSLQESVACGTL